ncbi:hypothetical protein BDV32DRAFT_130510, partial [Aspergillus pseudonomiae]
MARVNYGDNEWTWTLLGVWLVLGGLTPTGLFIFLGYFSVGNRRIWQGCAIGLGTGGQI